MKLTTNKLCVLVLLLSLAACAQSTPEPTPTHIPSPAPPTHTPTPPPPTATPSPIPPTDTPSPTDTPLPSPTPTPLPEPVTYTGANDTILDIEPLGPAVLPITRNHSARHFAVTTYGPGNEKLDLLINTTDPYDGSRPLDWSDDETTVRLEINAVGPWTIEHLPLAPIPQMLAHAVEIPATYESAGDDVIIILNSEPDIAEITGNDDSRYFGATAWTSTGRDLLINTTDPYAGTVLLDRQTFALEIVATGPWTVQFR